MKISTEAVRQLTHAFRVQLVKPEEIENELGQKVRVYYLEDLTLSFLLGERPRFFGLSFNALAQDFTVLASFELLVSLADDDGENAYSIEDKSTVLAIEEYLLWRAKTLQNTGL